MPIDSRARAFIEANIGNYREVALALRGFEGEVESVLRSICRGFKGQLAAVGIREENASFRAYAHSSRVSNMALKGRATGIEIGLWLQCRDADDKLGQFVVFSSVWVKDPDVRKSLDRYVVTHSSAPFVHEFEYGTTYLSAYLDPSMMPRAVDLLRESFEMLFECLFGSPEFCKSYRISGPAEDGGANHGVRA